MTYEHLVYMLFCPLVCHSCSALSKISKCTIFFSLNGIWHFLRLITSELYSNLAPNHTIPKRLRIVIIALNYRQFSADTNIENYEIYTSVVYPRGQRPRVKKLALILWILFQNSWKLVCSKMQYTIFLFKWEPVLIQQILISFKAILEKSFYLLYHVPHLTLNSFYKQQQIGTIMESLLIGSYTRISCFMIKWTM